jgi:hypothetical protein
MRFEWEGSKVRGEPTHGMDGGANVMLKSWESELSRPSPSAQFWVGFEHDDLSPGACECDRRGESIGS